MADNPAPTQLGNRYEIAAVLGEGGMGQVLLVRDTSTGKDMAMKILRPDLAKSGDRNWGQVLQQEFWTMTRLRHPRTVEAFDYGLLPDGTPYFTMEAVNGTDLLNLAPLEANQIVDLLAPICDAIGYIHSQGFIHGDLKPANLRMTPSGDIKLMDYGLMERAGLNGGIIRGTPYYVAPEVVRGGPVDQRADLYALGALAYHLLTGRPPFDGASAVEVFKKHLHEIPHPPSGITLCPPELEEIILKLLSKDPVDRFQSAADVAEALGREAHAGKPLILAASFVGREGELQRLRECFNSLGSGVPGVLVSGDAGMGKSRLLGEFRVQIQLAEVPHAAGVCYEQNEAPYGPWISILRQVVSLARYHAPETLEAQASVLASLLPELGTAAPSLEPKEEALRLGGAIAELIYAVAERAESLVVFLEDIHWLDPRSEDLLAYLLRSAGTRPLMVVATSRSASGEKPYADYLEPMPLAGLGIQDLTLAIASALGGAAVPDSFAQAAHRMTGGNPLFTEVLLRHLAATGSLKADGHRWEVSAAPVPDDVPAELRELLTSRFERLPEDARRLAAVFAASGRAMSLELLLEVWDTEELPDAQRSDSAEAAHTPRSDGFFTALECLRREGIITADLGEFRLAHASQAEVLYASLPDAERQNWHGRLANALDAVLDVGDPDRALVLAYHYLASAEPDKAIRFCLPAGRRAAELFANDLARHVLSSGLALIERKEVAADRATKLEMLVLLSEACRMAGDLDAALQAGDEATDLATAVGDLAIWARAQIGQGRVLQIRGDLEKAKAYLEKGRDLARSAKQALQLCRALGSLGRIAYFGQDTTAALAHYEELLGVAKDADLAAQKAEALAFVGFASVTTQPDKLDEGLALLHESLAIRQELVDRFGLLDTYMLLGNAYLALGHYPQARECFAHCQHLAYVCGHKDEEIFSQLNLAVVGIEMGDFATAEGMATIAENGSKVTGSKYTDAMAKALRGTASLYLGRLAAAFRDFDAACDQASGLDHRYLDVILGAYHGEFLLQVGSPEAARRKATKALEQAESGGNKEMVPALLTLQGMIQVALGDLEEASGLLARAKSLAEAASAKGAQVKALRAMAMLAVGAQRFEAAQEHAEEGLRLAEEVGADYLMGELNRLLGDACHGLGQNGHAIRAYRAALTIAEQKGAPDLVARAHLGLSTAEPTRAGHHLGAARDRVMVLVNDMPDDDKPAFRSRWDKDLLTTASAVKQEGPNLDVRLSRLQRELNDFAGDFRKQQRDFGDVQSSQRRLQQLIDFSLTVNSIHDLREVLERALDLILAITGSERGFLLLFDGGVLRCQTYRNLYPEGRTAMDYQISRSIAEEVLRSEEPLCLVDAMSDDRFKNYESIQALQLRTVICVPLKIREQVVGVIYVDRQTINEEFKEADLDLVLQLAQLSSNAVENANLHGEWQDKGRKLEMLNDLSRTISTTLVMDEVLDLVVRMTLEVTKAERGFLLLWENERLLCKSAQDKFGKRLSDQTISMSICNTVMETSMPVCVTDAGADQEFSLKQSIMLMSLKTVMAVPLMAKGTLLGVLYVDSQAIVNTFTQRDLELLESIASHASVALENAQLYHQISKRAQEQQRTIQLYEEANMRAATDVLTGLYNRRYFQDELSRDFAAARRHRRDLSVLMVDLDHFKSFNDTYGHHVGDAVLVAVSQVLLGAVRLADRAARYGGEEFIVNLPDTDLKGALVVAERIRKGVTELKFEEGIRPITVSVGVASIQAQDDRIAELIERADQALFNAKAKGRDRVEALEETEV